MSTSELPPAALRALAEAEERRRLADLVERPVELGGRNGPEPVRYGDWEKKGLAVDFLSWPSPRGVTCGLSPINYKIW
jgi:hypothetical protein